MLSKTHVLRRQTVPSPFDNFVGFVNPETDGQIMVVTLAHRPLISCLGRSGSGRLGLHLSLQMGIAQSSPFRRRSPPYLRLGKSQHYLLNFRESPIFLPELQNRPKHLPPLLKPFILPLWPCYKRF